MMMMINGNNLRKAHLVMMGDEKVSQESGVVTWRRSLIGK